MNTVIKLLNYKSKFLVYIKLNNFQGDRQLLQNKLPIISSQYHNINYQKLKIK
jgi:hypothetical protein